MNQITSHPLQGEFEFYTRLSGHNNLRLCSDYFGLDGDPFTTVPANVSSVVDLLEDKGITWGLYQEDMPYTGFQGMEWRNELTGADAYVRKHK